MLATHGAEYDRVRQRLVSMGMEPGEAERLLEAYVEAHRNSTSERLRQEAARRELERTKQTVRTPIVQCQVCKSTANYWAPCWVAPMEIGYEENEVPVYL